MILSTKELTLNYLEGKTLDQFAAGLGIEITKQSVSLWKDGNRSPSMETLLSVLASPEAEGWAKSWAGECFAALQRQAMSLSVK